MDEQGKTPIIEFKDVKFSYDRQKKVIDKTTIFNLITGICHPDSGVL